MSLNMVRPDWFEFIAKINANLMCTCGEILQSQRQVREHWQMGHYDYQERTTEVHDDERKR